MKLVHLVGIITRKFVMMHGHMNVNIVYQVCNVDVYNGHGLLKIEFNTVGLNCIIIE